MFFPPQLSKTTKKAELKVQAEQLSAGKFKGSCEFAVKNKNYKNVSSFYYKMK